MVDFAELQMVLQLVGEDIRTYLSTAYPWLPVTVVAGFSLANSIRVLAYVPQILKASRDENGATAISFVTWGLFLLSHMTTVAYALVQLADVVMALIFLGNALACLTILVIAVTKRKRHLQANSRAGSQYLK